MRRYVWILRACLLLVAGVAGLGAVKAREPDEPARDVLWGVTGQRQPTEFDVDEQGRPRRFATTLYSQCPAGWERSFRWTTASFGRTGSRFRVEERHGEVRLAMLGRVTPAGLQGRMRAVWRFERDGKEYLVCDSGFVPFAAGDGANGRLARMRPSALPWTTYPERRPPAAPGPAAQRRFVARLEAVCERAWLGRPSGVWWDPLIRAHQRELDRLEAIGRPPARRGDYDTWIWALSTRLNLERSQQWSMQHGDFDAAARWAAAAAAQKAKANAAALRLGLRACSRTGPVGAPKS